ncbi:tRNA lysidine(34) synthetase TilS [Rheinheimera sp. 1928-s]|uniref:tRNA lysidine(34) synthetase TilS n=1 Tax=Rheinheimera sp. 1928-s TaxID=3033803 RepID=UPI0026384A30|nr:tRNA lysidine(34) synthetase TilS [Rheinheimera sp. 1928-s]MDF3124313.1 tRNA lysidine(34) synthetase TilS [Rheinheimera sp. 1928-s]
MSLEFTTSLRQHIQQLGLNQLVLGLSGGLDSMVLLELCHQLTQSCAIKLKAVYIHHGLSANADQWAEFCLQQCVKRDIAFEVQKVQLNPAGNIEAQARTARYSALSAFVVTPQTALLTAHHADDQLETLLLALKRGAGPAGLSGIAALQSFAAGWLLRPLLEFSREQLEAFAKEQQLEWIEDESNADSRFDRNFLRLQVIPLLQQRWPAFRQNALRSVTHIQQHQQFVETQLEQLLPTVMHCAELDLKLLTAQDFTTQKLLVRRWLALTGLNPSTDWLERFFAELIGAKADAQPLLELDAYQIRRFADKAYVTQVTEIPQAGVLLELQPGQQLDTVVGQFLLNSEGKGTALLLTDDPLYLVFGLFSLPFKPAGERQSKALKQWLKLWAIPPWQRLQLPVLVQNNQVVAVLGLASNAAEDQANAYIDWDKGLN